MIDTKAHEIVIVSDERGKYVFSKKGSEQKPLVDLRNAEIKEEISMAEYMEIEIKDNKIVVHVIKKNVNVEGLSDRELVEMLDKSEKVTFEISKESLAIREAKRISSPTYIKGWKYNESRNKTYK